MRQARSWSARSARQTGSLLSRTSFSPREANVVVSTDGYFDVFPWEDRVPGTRPAYRGALAELGAGIRGADDRLAVRPTSVALLTAVHAWAELHGAAAARGEMGKGRDGTEPKP
jgi:hypothetical protein